MQSVSASSAKNWLAGKSVVDCITANTCNISEGCLVPRFKRKANR